MLAFEGSTGITVGMGFKIGRFGSAVGMLGSPRAADNVLAVSTIS